MTQYTRVCPGSFFEILASGQLFQTVLLLEQLVCCPLVYARIVKVMLLSSHLPIKIESIIF